MDLETSVGDRRILHHVECDQNAAEAPSVKLCVNFYWAHHCAAFFLTHLAIHFFNQKCVQYQALRHYAIITSPRGLQLDFWLVVMCAMDMVPLLLGLVTSWFDGVFRSSGDHGDGLCSKVLLNVAYIMQDWSPAYQFNQLVLGLVNGSFVDHTYVIMFMTVAITESHRLLVKQLYCKQVNLAIL